MKRPRCKNCNEKPTRKRSLFCTDRCAVIYAENICAVVDEGYCAKCGEWSTTAYKDKSDGDRIPLGCGTYGDDGSTHYALAKKTAYDWSEEGND